jgi:hypothetical protein
MAAEAEWDVQVDEFEIGLVRYLVSNNLRYSKIAVPRVCSDSTAQPLNKKYRGEGGFSVVKKD